MSNKFYLYTETLSESRKALPVSEVKELVPKRSHFFGQAYTSAFYFDNEMVTHMKNNYSEAGFNGNVYGDWVILDFDTEESLDFMSQTLAPLLDDLESEEVYYRLFYSGRKGYHLYIHKHWIDYPESLENKFNIVAKKTAEYIVEFYDNLEQFVDLSVYNQARLMRFPYSWHQKSKLQKVALKYKGESVRANKMFVLTEEEPLAVIREIFNPTADMPEEKFLKIEKPTQADHTMAGGHRKVYKVGESQNHSSINDTPYGQKLCIHKMLHTHSFPKHRHNTALRLMSHYARNLAMPEPAVRGLMYEWNNALDEPMPDKEVDRILRSFPGYIYKCSDFIKARYCDKRCMEYSGQVEDGNKHLYTGEEFGSLIVEISKETDDDWIRLDKIYPHLTLSPIKPRHGHMSCIVGGSSCGKTTFVLEVMQNMKHINWLMLSYDMASSSMAYVMSKKNKIDPDKLEHDKQEQQRFANIMSNIAFLDDSSIALQDIERYYHQVCRKYRTKYNAIVIDYLGLVPTRGDAKERATQIAMKMKDFAKKNQVAIIFLVQVPKNMAGDANLYLGMDAAKDSGEIVNLADHVLTFWRPEKGGQDRILRANVAKDKYSAADYTVDLHWKGNHCIGNMPASYYNQ